MHTLLRLLAMCGVVGLLAACAHATPFQPRPVPDDIREGPGILSGEEGAFTIYSR